MMMRLRVERNTRSSDLEKSVGGSSAMSSRVCIDVCACACIYRALLLKKKWRFSNLKFDIKRAHTKARHTLTDEKREREKEPLSKRSFFFSLSPSLSLSFSLSVRVCSCEIYKKRDVSIDDDDQQRGTR